jgi:hypothetical protein
MIFPMSARTAEPDQRTGNGPRQGIASTRYAATTRGKPTFPDLDKPYPNQIFTALVWGENREKFGTPEEKYRDKQVCVTGKIAEYRGAAEIVVSDPHSIKLQK